MNYPLQALIQMGALAPVTFPPDSRYYGSATLQYTAPNGQAITYLAIIYLRSRRAEGSRTRALHRAS